MTVRRHWPWVALLLALLTCALAWLALRTGLADATNEVVWNIRAPRIVLALIVGAGLAAAGVMLQGSLRNPLADPALIGVSAAAALGCVAGAALGVPFGTVGAAVAATIGAALAMTLVVSVSTRDGRPEVVSLLLAGVAVSAFAAALVAILVATSPDAGVRSLVFWTTGSLSLATWPGVLTVSPFVLLGLALAATTPRALDVLALGDRDATAVGIDVRSVRIRAQAAVVLLIAAGVAVVGVIAFIGLVIPHAVRLLIGPRTAPLLVMSTLFGAALLLLADTVARTVANPIEIPVGAVTALIGAPVFFLLLWRTRRQQGGWA